jgi:hypothetical protein
MADNEELLDNPLQAVHDQLEQRYGAKVSIGDSESDEAWYTRMQQEGYLVVFSGAEMRDANTARLWKQHEAAGRVVLDEDVLWGDRNLSDANGSAPETRDPRAAALSALPVQDRFRAYLAQRKEIVTEPGPSFSKTQ